MNNKIEMTDQEVFEALKKDFKDKPEIYLSPEKWKEMRLIELKKENKIWSK